MTKYAVLLAPYDVMAGAYIAPNIVSLVNDNLSRFERVDVKHDDDLKDEAAAEEIFDLTNNPHRQDEREEKYGRRRSLSVGDVVEVNNVRFICDFDGWQKM